MNTDDEAFKTNLYEYALPFTLHEMKSETSMLRNEIIDISRLIEGGPSIEYSANIKNRLSRLKYIAERLNSNIDYLGGLTRASNSYTNIEPISIKQLEHLLHNAIPHAIPRSRKIKFKPPSDIDGLYVLGDTALITTIFMNLLQNAKRHSIPNTEITTTIDLSNRTFLLIEVTNMCSAKSLLEINEFFDPGFRSKESYNYSNGAGLGLTVVSKICDDLDYDITLLSLKIDSKTSCFQVSLKMPILNK